MRMARLEPEALRAARKASALRYLGIAAKYTPTDIQISYRSRLTGCAWARSRRISVPRPVTRRALHVYLHEVAHVVLAHFHEKPVHLQEYEAEAWAFGIMEAEGVAIPWQSRLRAQAYVAQKVLQDKAQGGPVHPAAAAFANIAL
jgi:hypothetical protein